MEPRIAHGRVAPDAVGAMRGIEQYVTRSGLERALLELVKTRAPRITGRGFRTVAGTYQPSEAREPAGAVA